MDKRNATQHGLHPTPYRDEAEAAVRQDDCRKSSGSVVSVLAIDAKRGSYGRRDGLPRNKLHISRNDQQIIGTWNVDLRKAF